MKSQPPEPDPAPEAEDATAGAGTSAATPSPLRRLAEPLRSRLTLAVSLQAVAALAGVVPFIAVSRIAEHLTSGTPADGDTLWPL